MDRKVGKAPTVVDVARLAGVSPTTVSNLLNRSVSVSKKTQIKIEKAISELHYVPNTIARGLRVRKTNNIGLIIPDITNSFYTEVAKGIEEYAQEMGYTLLLSVTNYDREYEEKRVESLVRKYVDGIIFTSSATSEEYILSLINSGFPVVVMDRRIENDQIPSVEVRNREGVFEAINYLIKLGHRKIFFISEDPLRFKTVEDRLQGYKDALLSNGIEFNENHIFFATEKIVKWMEHGYEFTKKIILSSDLPTAIFSTSDTEAIGILCALAELGIKVPKEMSVMGFDNIKQGAFTVPPLTTVKQPKKTLGKAAMNLLLQIINGEVLESNKIYFDLQIIERKSVAPPKIRNNKI